MGDIVWNTIPLWLPKYPGGKSEPISVGVKLFFSQIVSSYLNGFELIISAEKSIGGIGTPIFSAFAEKYGDRKAITVGLLLYALGVFISSTASSPEAQNISGKYFYKKKEKKSSMESLIINSRKKLWEKTETMLKEWN